MAQRFQTEQHSTNIGSLFRLRTTPVCKELHGPINLKDGAASSSSSKNPCHRLHSKASLFALIGCTSATLATAEDVHHRQLQLQGFSIPVDFTTANTDKDAVISKEEVLVGSVTIEAPIPMELVGEVGLCMKQAIASIVGIEEFYIKLAILGSAYTADPGTGAEGSISTQGFLFQFVILPAAGKSSKSRSLLVDSGSGTSPTLLTALAALMRKRRETSQIQVTTAWSLKVSTPQITVVPVQYPSTWSGGTTTSTTEAPLNPHIDVTPSPVTYASNDTCNTVTLPCQCATMTQCTWVMDSYGIARCKTGSGGVACSDCDSQVKCPAAKCGLLSSGCSCAASSANCRWDDVLIACVERGKGWTSCSSCASQSFCRPPVILQISPNSGALLQFPRDLQLHVVFNHQVLLTGRSTAAFTCNGQSIPFNVPLSGLTASGNELLISVQTLLDKANLEQVRSCYLQIGAGTVADADGTPFLGMAGGSYFIRIAYNAPPTVVSFEPKNGAENVGLGARITFTFSESIKLVDGNLQAELYKLQDSSPSTSSRGAQVALIKMSSNIVSVYSSMVTIDVSSHIESGSVYSLALPAGSLTDLYGNAFPGLPSGSYYFAVAGVQSVPAKNIPQGGVSPTIMAGIAAVAALMLLLSAAFAIWRLLRLRRLNLTVMRAAEKVSVVKPMPVGSPTKQTAKDLRFTATVSDKSSGLPFQVPTGEPFNPEASQRSSWAERVHGSTKWQEAFLKSSTAIHGLSGMGAAEATMTRERSNRFSATYPGPRATKASPSQASSPPAEPNQSNLRRSPTSFHPNRSSSHGRSGPPPSQNAKAPNCNAPGFGSTSSGFGSTTGSLPKQAPVTSTDMSDDSAALKAKKLAVERKLRSLMDATTTEKKKVLRELMLEYHPDKNSDLDAKEVFQFINASRGWFMVET